MVAEVNKEILSNEKISITVLDENATRQDAVLGVGSFLHAKALRGEWITLSRVFAAF